MDRLERLRAFETLIISWSDIAHSEMGCDAYGTRLSLDSRGVEVEIPKVVEYR
jgi:hypothetical protein